MSQILFQSHCYGHMSIWLRSCFLLLSCFDLSGQCYMLILCLIHICSSSNSVSISLLWLYEHLIMLIFENSMFLSCSDSSGHCYMLIIADLIETAQFNLASYGPISIWYVHFCGFYAFILIIIMFDAFVRTDPWWQQLRIPVLTLLLQYYKHLILSTLLNLCFHLDHCYVSYIC